MCSSDLTGQSVKVSLSIAVKSKLEAPRELAYPQASYVFVLKTKLEREIYPQAKGGAITKFTVSPPLPTGLSLDPAKGFISGTPAQEWEQSHTVTAENGVGKAKAVVLITVKFPDPKIEYLSPAVPFLLGAKITSIKPRSTAGAVDSYSVNRRLPDGLVLSEKTGEISGTPAKETGAADYVITATNRGGTASAVIRLEVGTSFRQYQAVLQAKCATCHGEKAS